MFGYGPIERLVEHVLVLGAVPCLDVGFDLPEQVGARLLLGGEASWPDGFEHPPDGSAGCGWRPVRYR